MAILKLVRMCTLNMNNFLYVNLTSIKWSKMYVAGHCTWHCTWQCKTVTIYLKKTIIVNIEENINYIVSPTTHPTLPGKF